MIFIDLDGPILDVSEKYYRVYVDLVNELRGIPLGKDDYWERKRSKMLDSEILYESRLSEADHSVFRLRREKRIETSAYWKYDQVWPELKELMPGSPLRGKLVLVTLRNSSDALAEELAALGIRDWFKIVLTAGGEADSTGRHNGKVRAVNRIFGELSEGWFIGDTETDLRAGSALGLKRGAVTFGIRSRYLIERESPDKVFLHPSELTSWLRTLSKQIT